MVNSATATFPRRATARRRDDRARMAPDPAVQAGQGPELFRAAVEPLAPREGLPCLAGGWGARAPCKPRHLSEAVPQKRGTTTTACGESATPSLQALSRTTRSGL
jgi:hypothetical protein